MFQISWRKFPRESYDQMLQRMGDGDYAGSVHMGDLCFDFIDRDGELNYDCYVYGEEGYDEKDGIPYDEADGGAVPDEWLGLPYREFREKVNRLLMRFVNEHDKQGSYSLKAKAEAWPRFW